jgi:transcriptional regulator with XRE-family HTH domain
MANPTHGGAESAGTLGAFLRASRNASDPERHGFSTTGRRRAIGMRREEVAARAGVSVDYYTRLEQARERNPSLQVVDALARVFAYDRATRQHVYRLAGLMPTEDLAPSDEVAAPELKALIDAWSHTPAVVFTRAYDALAFNRLGAALYAPLDPRRNLCLAVFIDPAARSFYGDWPRMARDTVAALRLALGESPNDPRLQEVVASLTRLSPEFVGLWADPRVHQKAMYAKRLVHPAVGMLELTMQTFDVRSAPGQHVIVYHPVAGSRSDDGLRILDSLSDATV